MRLNVDIAKKHQQEKRLERNCQKQIDTFFVNNKLFEDFQTELEQEKNLSRHLLKMIQEKEVEIAKYQKRLSKEQIELVSEETLKFQFDSVVEKAYHNTYKEYSQ